MRTTQALLSRLTGSQTLDSLPVTQPTSPETGGDDGVDDIATERILASIYARHWKDINDLRTKYISYSTKNSARGFQSSSESPRTGTEAGQSNQPQNNPSQPVGNEGQGRGGDSRTGEANSGASLGEIIASRARAERELLRYLNRYYLSLRARTPDLFESSEAKEALALLPLLFRLKLLRLSDFLEKYTSP